MEELNSRDATTLAGLLEELATAITLGTLSRSAVEPIGRAIGVNDAAGIGDELDRLAQQLRDFAE